MQTSYLLKIPAVFVFILTVTSLIAGQYRFDQWTTDDGLPQNSVNGLEQSDDGYIWGATNGGIVHNTKQAVQVFSKKDWGTKYEKRKE